jgi:speckle-type POZ protein
LKITCGSDTYNVHKIILCAQCAFFKKACATGRFKEGETGAIDLPEDEPSIVNAMLQYLYTFDYNYAVDEKQDPLAVAHAKVYALADKYDIGPLKTVAGTKFKAAAELLAETPHFLQAIRLVYETTPSEDRGLRDITVEVSKECFSHLLKDPEFDDLLQEKGHFGRDLLHAIAPAYVLREPAAEACRCPSCSRIVVASFRDGYVKCPSCGTNHHSASWTRCS